jgi:hypothetical protein
MWFTLMEISNNIVVIQYSNNKYVTTKSSGLAFIAIDYYYAYNYNRLLI